MSQVKKVPTESEGVTKYKYKVDWAEVIPATFLPLFDCFFIFPSWAAFCFFCLVKDSALHKSGANFWKSKEDKDEIFVFWDQANMKLTIYFNTAF